MSELADYRALIAIIERGSLTEAARHLGRSLQSVSRSLQMLEEQLGVELVARTTRRCRPTPAGQAFYDRLKTALADIALARDSVMQEGTEISGRIRVGASSRFGVAYVLPVLTAFMERHPKIDIDLNLDDAYMDLLAEHLDLSIQVGRLPDSTLRMRRIGAIRRVVFAAPRYLAARGRPAKPDELRQHDCITHQFDAGQFWSFGEGGDALAIPVQGRFRSNSAPARIAAAVAGLGIAMAPLYQIRALVESGQLELLLPEHEPSLTDVQIVWPPGPLPARTRLLIDFIAARLSLAGV